MEPLLSFVIGETPPEENTVALRLACILLDPRLSPLIECGNAKLLKFVSIAKERSSPYLLYLYIVNYDTPLVRSRLRTACSRFGPLEECVDLALDCVRQALLIEAIRDFQERFPQLAELRDPLLGKSTVPTRQAEILGDVLCHQSRPISAAAESTAPAMLFATPSA